MHWESEDGRKEGREGGREGAKAKRTTHMHIRTHIQPYFSMTHQTMPHATIYYYYTCVRREQCPCIQ